MNPARITVSIPFVSGVPYFERALASVFRQRLVDWRAIICDNSVDPEERGAAKRVVERYADSRLSFVSASRHLDICANFNRALDLAETDLVAILHSDDEYLPHYLDTMVAAAEKYPDAPMLFCRAKIIGASGAPVFSFVDAIKPWLTPPGRPDVVLRGEAGLTALLRGNFIMGPTVCFRKSRLGDLRWPENLKMAADLEYYARVIIAGHTIVGLTGPPEYAYRRHSQSTTAKFNENLYRFEEETRTYDAIARKAAAMDWRTAAQVAQGKLIVRLHLLYEIASDCLARRWSAALRKCMFLASLDRPTG